MAHLFFSRDVPAFNSLRITATATGTVKATSGFLHAVTINDITTSGALALYDDTNLATGFLASIRVSGSREVLPLPTTAIYDISFGTALSYDLSGAGDITISFL